MKSLPDVLIVGRPNVGKSTLFNRLAGKSLALVDSQPGSTRDLKSTEIEWNGVEFLLTDSGGWVPGEKETIALKVRSQLENKLETVSALILVVDGQQGLVPADELIVRTIRKRGIPTWLVVNKADQPERLDETASDFQHLGFQDCIPLSSLHGIGIDDLLDSLAGFLKKGSLKAKPVLDHDEKTRPLRLAVLGKPNVGKSSLVNALLGQNRLLVDDLPGTTHDAVPVILEAGENHMVLVDTAGMRAHKKLDSRIEKLSVEQALYELKTCQVVLLLLDGEKGIAHQDVTISHILSEAFRPVVMVINKWDIHPKAAEQSRAERVARRELKAIHFAPILFVSTLTGMNMEKIIPTAMALYEESCRKVPTRRVNVVLQEAVAKHSPPYKKGHQTKFFYGCQRTGHPPVIEIFANHPESITPSYLRYVESEMRKALDLTNTPLQLVLKANKSG
jgi:GTP-binding protein